MAVPFWLKIWGLWSNETLFAFILLPFCEVMASLSSVPADVAVTAPVEVGDKPLAVKLPVDDGRLGQAHHEREEVSFKEEAETLRRQMFEVESSPASLLGRRQHPKHRRLWPWWLKVNLLLPRDDAHGGAGPGGPCQFRRRDHFEDDRRLC